MDLEIINQELKQISKELQEKLPELKLAEYNYNKVYFDSIIKSGMGNAQAREAEAFLTCDQEGVLVPFEELKIIVRTLVTRKECLIEISKNIRITRGNENNTEQ